MGAGHTGRCLVIAKILRDAGYECLFLSDPTFGLVSGEGFPVLEPGTTRRPRARMPRSGYLPILGMDDAYAAAGYYHPGRIARKLAGDEHILSTVAPSVVVTDMQPTICIAAQRAGIPALSVVDGDFLRKGRNSWMYWVPDAAKVSPYPASLPAFNQVLRESGMPAIGDVSDLLRTERVVVASVPEVDPVAPADQPPAMEYVGPLIWDPAQANGDDLLAGFPDGAPNVYVSVGSGEIVAAGLIRSAAQAVHREGWNLLLAPGYAAAAITQDLPSSMRLHRFGGIRRAVDWADIVVCHGGHATVQAALLAATPLVVAPAMSEMEGNGRVMVERTGSGFLLWRTEWDEPAGTLRVVPRYAGTAEDLTLGADALVRAVGEALSEPGYARNAARLSETLRRRGTDVADRIVAHVRSLAGREAP